VPHQVYPWSTAKQPVEMQPGMPATEMDETGQDEQQNSPVNL